FPAVPTLPDSFPFRFRSEFEFRWPLEWPCLSADSTLSETFGREIGFVIRSKESMALRKIHFR
ncbi:MULTISPECIES: hypothetical protein, partial [unclassified Streptomyces]|uniref:hypothetical protein n=1 Tax=unclassified Streptomyces TaxID=2593676 RepID=UPI00380168D0